MKYYVEKKDDNVISYGSTSELPEGVTEITEEEYNNGIASLAEADKKAQEEAEVKAREEQEAREKASEERQKAIDDYVSKVKAGTVKIDDVPADYKTAVNNIINPPKSETEKKFEEMQKQIDATTEALNSVMMNIAQ